MEELDIRKIWEVGRDDQSPEELVSKEVIDLFRQKQSKNMTSSTRKLMLFDIVMKIIVGFGYGAGFMLTPGQLSVKIISLIMLLSCFGLAFWESRFIKKLNAIDETGTILETLKKKISFHIRYYQSFIFLSALTSPLLILCGFFLYEISKYGEVVMGSPFSSPVPYLFLLAGFLISYVASRPFYRIRLEELTASLEDLDDSFVAYQTMSTQKRQRRKRIILFSLLALTGILVLLLVFWLRTKF